MIFSHFDTSTRDDAPCLEIADYDRVVACFVLIFLDYNRKVDTNDTFI